MSKTVKKIGKAAVGASVGLVVGGPAGAIAGAAAMTKPGKKLLKGASKVFKKVWNSKIGRIVIIAAAVYFGGAALGYWNSPIAAINGSLANTPLVGANARAATTAAAGPGAAGGGAGVAAPEALSSASLGTGSAGAGIVENAAEQSLKSYLSTNLAGSAGEPGIIGKVLSGVGKVGSWMSKNQLVTAVGLSGLANALTPSEIEEAEDARRDRVREMNQRMSDIGSINIGISPVDRSSRPVQQVASAAPVQSAQLSAPAPAPQMAPSQPAAPVQVASVPGMTAPPVVAPARAATPVAPQVATPDSAGIIAQRLRLGIA